MPPNPIACQDCGFSIAIGDAWCSGCGNQLVHLVFSPATIETFLQPETVARIRLENRGVLPFNLSGLALDGHSGTVEPYDIRLAALQPGQATDVVIRLEAQAFGDGRIVAGRSPEFASATVRVRPVPTIQATDVGDAPPSADGDTNLPVRVVTFDADDPAHTVTRIVSRSDTVVLPASTTSGPVGQIRLHVQSTPSAQNEVVATFAVTLKGLEKPIDVSCRLDARVRPRLALRSPGTLLKDYLFVGTQTTRDCEVEFKNVGAVPCRLLAMVPTDACKTWVTAVSHPTGLLEPGAVGSFWVRIAGGHTEFESGALADLGVCLTVEYSDPPQQTDLTLSWRTQAQKAKRLRYPITLDFGTTNTCLAVWGDGIPSTKYLSRSGASSGTGVWLYYDHFGDMGDDTVHPTRFAIRDWSHPPVFAVDNKMLYGSPDDYYRVARFFKPHLGKKTSFVLLDRAGEARQFTARQLTEMYLRGLFERFRDRTGFDIEKVNATFPVAFTEGDKRKVEELRACIAAAAGIDQECVVTELDEATALAWTQFVHLQKDQTFKDGERRSFAVFDFGGGTTDLAVMVVRREGADVVRERIRHAAFPLGGEEVTFRIARELLKKIQADPREAAVTTPGTNLGDEQLAAIQKIRFPEADESEIARGRSYTMPDRATFVRMRYCAEQLKHGLLKNDARHRRCSVDFGGSGSEGTTVQFKLPGYSFEKSLKRDKSDELQNEYNGFEVAILKRVLEPDLTAAFDTLAKLIAECPEIDARAGVDLVIICGNSSRHPMVWETAKNSFPGKNRAGKERVIFWPEFTKAGVVEGAALWCAADCPGIIDAKDRLPDVHVPNPLGVLHYGDFKTLIPAGPQTTSPPEAHITLLARSTQTLVVYEKRGLTTGPGWKPVARLPVEQWAGCRVEIRLCFNAGRLGAFISVPGGSESAVWSECVPVEEDE